jgi:nucleotide-binding universal stress UspA family protein
VPLIAANDVPSGPYRRLLVPVDLEDASHRAAQALRALDFASEAEVTLLHVYDAEAREMLGRAMVSSDEREEYLTERAAAAKEELRSFAASVGLENAALRVEESRGPMTAEIERVAGECGTDLIVLARSDKGVIGRSILGSVTEDLLGSGKLDVFVVSLPQ